MFWCAFPAIASTGRSGTRPVPCHIATLSVQSPFETTANVLGHFERTLRKRACRHSIGYVQRPPISRALLFRVAFDTCARWTLVFLLNRERVAVVYFVTARRPSCAARWAAGRIHILLTAQRGLGLEQGIVRVSYFEYTPSYAF